MGDERAQSQPESPQPKVSIVTISFNQAEYLEQAIESVLAQDYPHIEYIVVDPGSGDGSRDIIERFRAAGDAAAHRISRIIYHPDRGPADGLNHGFAAATGSIFAYLNADDILLPGAVSRAVGAFRDVDLGVVHADGYFINATGKVLRRCFSHDFSARNYVLGRAFIMQQSSFWRSQLHWRVGGFNAENTTWWDGEFFFTIALAGGRFRHVREYWSCFRIHRSSITGSGRSQQRYIADQQRMLAPHLAPYSKRYGRLLPFMKASAPLMKYLRDPRIVALRLSERLSGPPAIAKPAIPMAAISKKANL